ncbi:MAG: EAL domain-containing protein [Xanthomonadales bacterium]|nr:EAL domain-containing protein [Xanthomonadales bacterium]
MSRQLVQGVAQAGSAKSMVADSPPRSAIMLFPDGATLPSGWQAPWIKAGWLVSACPSSGRIRSVLPAAVAASPSAEESNVRSKKNAVRAIGALMRNPGAANDGRSAPTIVAGGMLRRSDFLAQLGSLSETGSQVSVLMAIHLDQATALDARLDRTAVFALEEAISSRIAAALEPDDSVTLWLEYGFGVLVQRKTADEVSALAGRICAGIAAEPFIIDAEPVELSVSIGLALSPYGPCPNRAQEWFSTAHAAQGIASRHGGNRHEGVLSRDYEPMAAERVLIIREWVAEAKVGKNVIVEFQPLMPASTKAGELYSVHAKLRDYRAPLGGVYRREYLRMAREVGAMIMIDRISLFHAFETLEQEHRAGRKTRMLVPVELDTLRGLAWRWLVEELRRRPHLRDRLIIELQATPNLTDKDNLMRIISLRRFGVRVSLSEQVGNLAQMALLTKLPIDFLRISYAAVASTTDAEFSAAMQDFKAHGRQLIVDSVSDIGCVSRLAGLGVDYLRGQALAATGPRLDYDFSAAL